MSIIACPTEVVAAPAERIWELLGDASSLARWTDTRLLEGPQRPLQAGDRIVYATGPGLRAIFDVLEVVPRQTLRVDVAMSFGIVNHEVIQLAALDGAPASPSTETSASRQAGGPSCSNGCCTPSS